MSASVTKKADQFPHPVAGRAGSIPVGVVGAGNVGRTLLKQIEELAGQGGRTADIAVRAVCNSRDLLSYDDSLTLDDWNARQTHAVAPNLPALPALLGRGSAYAPIIVDATASTEVARLHSTWLRAGAHVVTANKLGIAAAQRDYDELRRSDTARGIYAYETTVGAALPLVKTMRELHETGDRIVSVRGVLSGTLSYLFNAFDGSRPFSALLREALQLGITEPDPRIDLAGLDVARKLLILAREAGISLELGDIRIEGLVPASLGDCSPEDFLGRCAPLDDTLLLRLADARAAGRVLRYVGELGSDGSAHVGLRQCDRDSVFATLEHTENLVEITTTRYSRIPLVVRGPGAGREVTAAGVLAEILRLAEIEARRL